MFRIISRHSKLCSEITSKDKNIRSHFKQQKYDHSIIPTQFTYITISECYLLNHTNTHAVYLILLISSKRNVERTVSECTVRHTKLFGNSTLLDI